MPKIADSQRDLRRRALIDAAWRCVGRTGYRNLSVDDICLEAGVSKGAFYTYFNQKQDVLAALLERDADSMSRLVADAAGPSSGLEPLRRVVAGLVARGSDPSAAQLRAELWVEIIDDEGLRTRFRDATRERRNKLVEVIAKAIRDGEMVDIPPNALAAVLLALGDGLMLHRLLDPSGFRWSNVRRAVDAILEGLTPEGRE